jgi:hypothetical protein
MSGMNRRAGWMLRRIATSGTTPIPRFATDCDDPSGLDRHVDPTPADHLDVGENQSVRIVHRRAAYCRPHRTGAPFGSPRTPSAIVFRWISAVPAPIVAARLRR